MCLKWPRGGDGVAWARALVRALRMQSELFRRAHEPVKRVSVNGGFLLVGRSSAVCPFHAVRWRHRGTHPRMVHMSSGIPLFGDAKFGHRVHDRKGVRFP